MFKLWTDKITVLNLIKQENKFIWKKTILDKCFFGKQEQLNINGNTYIGNSSYIVRVPYSPSFLPRYEWEKIPNDRMEKFFTLSIRDVIVYGEVYEELDETGKIGITKNQVIEKYKNIGGAFEIKDFTDNSRHTIVKHYKVSG